MSKKIDRFWLKKLLDYAINIDMIWLVIWGTIFVSFVVLDSIFQTAYPGEDVFWGLQLGDHPVMIKVVGNGTFIGVTALKYIGIVLSFVYARRKFPNDHTLQIALMFTLLADTILTLDNVSVFGVLAFCFAQYFHIVRFTKTQPRVFAAYSLIVALLIMYGHYSHIPNMFILAGIYGFCLINNIILAFRWWNTVRKDHKNRTDKEIVASTCAFYGFILFILCDINVALSYLSVTGAIPIFIARYANFFAWLFYYPSQVLISNSSYQVKKPKKTGKKLLQENKL